MHQVQCLDPWPPVSWSTGSRSPKMPCSSGMIGRPQQYVVGLFSKYSCRALGCNQCRYANTQLFAQSQIRSRHVSLSRGLTVFITRSLNKFLTSLLRARARPSQRFSPRCQFGRGAALYRLLLFPGAVFKYALRLVPLCSYFAIKLLYVVR